MEAVLETAFKALELSSPPWGASQVETPLDSYVIFRPVDLPESLLRGLENIASGLPPRAIKSFKLAMNSAVTSDFRTVEVNLSGEAACIQCQLCLAFRLVIIDWSCEVYCHHLKRPSVLTFGKFPSGGSL